MKEKLKAEFLTIDWVGRYQPGPVREEAKADWWLERLDTECRNAEEAERVRIKEVILKVLARMDKKEFHSSRIEVEIIDAFGDYTSSCHA